MQIYSKHAAALLNLETGSKLGVWRSRTPKPMRC